MEYLERELKLLKILEDKQTILATQIKEKREYILNILDIEDCKQFKSDIATVSYVERKTIIWGDEMENILEEVKDLPKYIDIIPEHRKLNKTFEKDAKDGVYKSERFEIEVKISPMIRFKNNNN